MRRNRRAFNDAVGVITGHLYNCVTRIAVTLVESPRQQALDACSATVGRGEENEKSKNNGGRRRRQVARKAPTPEATGADAEAALNTEGSDPQDTDPSRVAVIELSLIHH